MIAEAKEAPLACSVCGKTNESVTVDTRRSSRNGTYTTALEVRPVRFLAGGMFHVCHDCQDGQKQARIRMPKASFTNKQADRMAAKCGLVVRITSADGAVTESGTASPPKAKDEPWFTKDESKMYSEYSSTMKEHGVPLRSFYDWVQAYRASKP